MRFDPRSPVTAATLVNTLPEADLADILYRYGEEPKSRQVARAIIKARPVETTGQLAQVVLRALPAGGSSRQSRLHPATRTFQALRIAVNRELEAIEEVLPQAVSLLKVGGRLAVISFHSLEDRIVKEYFREQSKDLINPPYERIYEVERKAVVNLVNRKPILPTEEETRVKTPVRAVPNLEL